MSERSDPRAPARAGWRRVPGTIVHPRRARVDSATIDFRIAGQSLIAPAPIEWEPHDHPVHELLWVRRGIMTTRVGRDQWTLPGNIGIWIPAGTEHHGRVSAGAEFQASFFAPEASRFSPREPVCITITPLLHELLMRLSRDDLDPAHRAHAEHLVFDLLVPVPRPLLLPVPEDARIAAIAATLVLQPDDPRTLEEWALELRLSARTLARAFVAETGESFIRWRQQLRVHAALGLLAEGASVAEAAEAVGYFSTSSFIAIFQRVTGTTPGRYQLDRSEAAEFVG